ncbi:MAG: TolC family protein [Myxococcota bacterium]
MTRVLMLGLAWLALLVAAFSEAAGQGDAGIPSEGSVPVQQEEQSTTTAAVPDGEPVLIVPGTGDPSLDDLAPGAQIVTDGEPLSMSEAVALAIRNGLDVEVDRYAPLIAEAEAAVAWGAYDPLLNADARYEVLKTPNTFALNPVSQNRDRVRGGGVGVTQLIPYLGATLNARFDARGTATRSRLQSLDEQFDSSFFLNARVPLLRNLVWNQAWTNVKLAGFASESAELQFRQALMDNVQGTVNRYWALVAARDRVRVSQKSLETARALLDQTKTQYEVGVVSQVEVVEAEAGVANREFELIQAANSYRNEQDLLIEAVYGTKLVASTTLQIVPTEDLQAYQLGAVDAEQSLAKAFENRPELAVAKTTIQQAEVELKFAKSQRLPQFDAEGRYGYVGISGDGNRQLADFNPGDGLPPVIPGDTSFADGTDDFFSRDGSNNWRVQGIFSVPIPNTAGRRGVDRSQFELRRSKSLLRRLEQGIVLEVRAASRTLLSAAQRIEAAERRRLAAEEQLRAERIRLEHGESTPFEVLQREEDLVEAESQKINALQLFQAAEIALFRAEGTILDRHSIEVDAVRAPVR